MCDGQGYCTNWAELAAWPEILPIRCTDQFDGHSHSPPAPMIWTEQWVLHNMGICTNTVGSITVLSERITSINNFLADSHHTTSQCRRRASSRENSSVFRRRRSKVGKVKDAAQYHRHRNPVCTHPLIDNNSIYYVRMKIYSDLCHCISSDYYSCISFVEPEINISLADRYRLTTKMSGIKSTNHSTVCWRWLCDCLHFTVFQWLKCQW